MERLPRKSLSGQSFFLGYMVVAVLTLFGSAFLGAGMTEHRRTDTRRMDAELYHMAYGAVEDATARFARAIADLEIDPNSKRFPARGMLETRFRASPSFPTGAAAYSVVEAQLMPDRPVKVNGAEPYAGTYLITATAAHPSNPEAQITLKRRIIRRTARAFEYAVLYDGDLEIHPASAMRLSGRIHANGDLYIGSEERLTIDSEYLRAAGRIYNLRKSNGAGQAGDVVIRRAEAGGYASMEGLDSRSERWANAAAERWGGTVRSGVHGVSELAVPSRRSIQDDGFYAKSAGLRIVDNRVFGRNGVELRDGVDVPPGTVALSNTFFNHREGRYVHMIELDLHKLAGYAETDPQGQPSYPNQYPANGLIYVGQTQTPEAHQPGVRLNNGAHIDRFGGLTVAGNLPVYIQGDFNIVDKQPAAVICDAVHVLSNHWTDDAALKPLQQRKAAETTLNLAMIAGSPRTMPGNYNGGLENYPRLHEDWSNTRLRIRGAFLALWESEVDRGPWSYGAPFYTAPRRDWDYDPDLAAGKLPPFTPWAVEAERGALWRE